MSGSQGGALTPPVASEEGDAEPPVGECPLCVLGAGRPAPVSALQILHCLHGLSALPLHCQRAWRHRPLSFYLFRRQPYTRGGGRRGRGGSALPGQSHSGPARGAGEFL